MWHLQNQRNITQTHTGKLYIFFLKAIKCNLLLKCSDIDILGGNVQNGEP